MKQHETTLTIKMNKNLKKEFKIYCVNKNVTVTDLINNYIFRLINDLKR